MPRIDESTITPQKRDRYPGVHKKVTEDYERLALGDSVNLDQYGEFCFVSKEGTILG